MYRGEPLHTSNHLLHLLCSRFRRTAFPLFDPSKELSSRQCRPDTTIEIMAYLYELVGNNVSTFLRNFAFKMTDLYRSDQLIHHTHSSISGLEQVFGDLS